MVSKKNSASRGVSPVVAYVMMIAIVVTTTMAAYWWLQPLSKELGAAGQITNLRNQMLGLDSAIKSVAHGDVNFVSYYDMDLPDAYIKIKDTTDSVTLQFQQRQGIIGSGSSAAPPLESQYIKWNASLTTENTANTPILLDVNVTYGPAGRNAKIWTTEADFETAGYVSSYADANVTSGSIKLVDAGGGVYSSNGSFASAPYNAGGVTKWMNISWTNTSPASTAVAVKVSVSNDSSTWTSWVTYTSGQAFGNASTTCSAVSDQILDLDTGITLYRESNYTRLFRGALGSGAGTAEFMVCYSDIDIAYGNTCMRGKTGPDASVKIKKTGESGGKPQVSLDIC
ncbi:MAG: hypothetical protein V1911_02935 [Candidatus Micrarchaeota archaeon]